jgi:hypothetical protein
LLGALDATLNLFVSHRLSVCEFGVSEVGEIRHPVCPARFA